MKSCISILKALHPLDLSDYRQITQNPGVYLSPKDNLAIRQIMIIIMLIILLYVAVSLLRLNEARGGRDECACVLCSAQGGLIYLSHLSTWPCLFLICHFLFLYATTLYTFMFSAVHVSLVRYIFHIVLIRNTTNSLEDFKEEKSESAISLIIKLCKILYLHIKSWISIL